jgi:hypothetical protein
MFQQCRFMQHIARHSFRREQYFVLTMAENGLTDVDNFGTTPDAPATSYFFNTLFSEAMELNGEKVIQPFYSLGDIVASYFSHSSSQ